MRELVFKCVGSWIIEEFLNWLVYAFFRTMKKKLLDWIVCPRCKRKLNLIVFKDENRQIAEIIDGILYCDCQSWYPIFRGIPRILPASLQEKILKDDLKSFIFKYKDKFPKSIKLQTDFEVEKFADVKKSTANAWGFQWKYFDNLIPESEDQFLKFITPVKKNFFRDKLVLDAGCGTGRHVYFAGLFGAEVIGVDLSYAVESAYQNNRNNEKGHIIQADIYNMPFRDNLFDYSLSIGVIHHLPVPEKGFSEIVKKTKENGFVSAWVYGKENNGFIVYFIDPLRKLITKNMNLKILNSLSFSITILYYIMTKFIYHPMSRNKITRKILKFLPYHDYFIQFSNFSFKHHWVNVLDKLDAPLANYYSKEKFYRWFRRAGLKDISILPVNNISWSGHARR